MQDERAVLVRLIEQGAAALRDEAIDVPRRFVAATGFELTEITKLHENLKRFTASLDSVGGGRGE